ncbi:DUF4974 domain-containing protein [Aestuariibacter sp. GS-14]|uniref:FecR family protein n=1 Tax=Aestuariibacter sp. GS-14 TaxID=2590670 RepID=UPI00112CCAAC|nr:FecR domain-containing protein [Aestuariibacter sp. GS-14]TPV61822.1 DUF4974 domain-containing protein [Aestuariibacter sp. GS-14]
MSNISQFNSKETIQAKACEWVAAIDRGISAEETVQLQHWLAANPSNQKMLFDMASLWDDMSVMHALQGLVTYQPRKKVRTASSRKWLAAAALIAVSVTGALSWNMLPSIQPEEAVASVSQDSATNVGEQKTVLLADGSKVFLNTDSQIRVNFFPGFRQIELLKGEAHFDVAHDPARPFTVFAGDSSVTAVGTAFNMEYTQGKAFELVVTEGKVRVSQQTVSDATTSAQRNRAPLPIELEGVMVFAGEQALINKSVSARTALTQSEIAQSLAWQDGQIVFTGQELTKALDEISRYTRVKFVIDDKRIVDTRIAGYFRVGDINGLLAALQNSFDIQSYKDSEQNIHLHRADSAI